MAFARAVVRSLLVAALVACSSERTATPAMTPHGARPPPAPSPTTDDPLAEVTHLTSR